LRGKPIAHQRAATLEVLGTHRTGLDRRAVAEAIGLSPDRARDVLHSLRNDGLVFVTSQGGRNVRWVLTEHRALAMPPRPVIVKRQRLPKPIAAPPAASVFHWRP
jgi:predicted ArsR family transcriptional regulator